MIFSTIGPDGESESEINGRAAAIETYLDLSVGPSPRIRWKYFEESIGEYHGALESKHLYAKTFRELERLGSYDFTKLELVLNTITGVCVSIAQDRMSAADCARRNVGHDPRLPSALTKGGLLCLHVRIFACGRRRH